jgi:crotonobetainyl-CoA:carnitine CoA-transferase CaiB-like acyl-CoA transferase
MPLPGTGALMSVRGCRDFDGPWAVVQTPKGIYDHQQVRPNGCLTDVTDAGDTFQVVAPQVQFDEVHFTDLRACPEHSEHTRSIGAHK